MEGRLLLERKNLTVILKAEDEGSVKAVFSTLNVIDKDGDVTLPGAFGDQVVNIAAWGHNWGDLPSGDGVIHEAKNEAVFEGSFYLGTPQGDATYQTLKQRHERGFSQEWSYGFDVLDAEPGIFDGKDVRLLKKLKVYEVSPVMVGAGEHTRTLAVKSLDQESNELVAAVSDAQELVAAFGSRMKVNAELRQKSGRSISAANRARIASVSDALEGLLGEIRGLIEVDDEPKGESEAEAVPAEEPTESVVSAELPEEVRKTLDRYLANQRNYSVI